MAEKALSARSGLERLGAVAIVSIIVIPVLIGGALIAALAAPSTHLNRVTAAIVNDDTPVKINGKTIPLGRQFSASLLSGSSDPAAAASAASAPSATNAAPATGATGSSADATASRNFTWTLTNDKDAAAGLNSGAYAAVVTIPSSFSADATSISGPAATAKQAVIRVDTSPSSAFIDPALSQAITTAATSALNQQLTAQYLQNIYAGFNSINQQIGQASTGATSVASGAASVSSGATSLASGASTLSSGLVSLDSGAASLSNGLSALSAQTQGLPGQTAQLAQGSSAVAAATGQVASGVDDATTAFAATVAQVCQRRGPLCTRATAALAKLRAADASAAQLASGAAQVASGNAELAAAMPSLVGGIDQATSGAVQVAAGAANANGGAASMKSGAASLATGAAQVDSGAAQLSQGLDQAVQKIPTYSDTDMSTLSTVASQPVRATQDADPAGSQSVPLFCVVALWLGGLVIALVRRAVPAGRLMSTASSWSLTLRSVGVSALFGAAQGLLIAPIALFSLHVFPQEWAALTALAVLVGAVFAVVNQGLVAAFGVVGRVVALFVAIFALVAGLASTVPPIFTAVSGLLPTAPALQALRAATVADSAGTWVGFAGCLLFAVIGIALVFAGVVARRGVRVRDLGTVPPPATPALTAATVVD